MNQLEEKIGTNYMNDVSVYTFMLPKGVKKEDVTMDYLLSLDNELWNLDGLTRLHFIPEKFGFLHPTMNARLYRYVVCVCVCVSLNVAVSDSSLLLLLLLL